MHADSVLNTVAFSFPFTWIWKMSVLYIAVALALVVATIAILAFVVQVKTDQLMGLDTPARSMLHDEE